jgi:hypothetical protein
MAIKKEIQIGYSDFLRICMINDPNDFLPGFEVRLDGVWVVPPSNDVYLTSEERAILSEHPKKDLTIPALAFPCSLRQLYDFLKFAEAVDCADPAELEKIQQLYSDQDEAVFPCSSQTKWDEIEMALLPAGDKFMIKTPLGRGYYDHMDFKLYDERTRNKKPSNLWVFLVLLAKGNGFVSLDGVQDFETLSSNAKRLDKHLKQLFGIKESIYKGRCDRIGGYETNFKISSILDDNSTINRKSLIDEELEDPQFSNIKESSYYPEYSAFEKE